MTEAAAGGSRRPGNTELILHIFGGQGKCFKHQCDVQGCRSVSGPSPKDRVEEAEAGNR